MFKGVGIAQNHSMIHQLLILWGLPVVLTVLLIICIIWEKLRGGANRSLYKLMKAISVPDLFAIVMGLCAIGLIVIPELVLDYLNVKLLNLLTSTGEYLSQLTSTKEQLN